jgi:hypothetical protein
MQEQNRRTRFVAAFLHDRQGFWPPGPYGCCNQNNKFPGGELMVLKLFVPSSDWNPVAS